MLDPQITQPVAHASALKPRIATTMHSEVDRLRLLLLIVIVGVVSTMAARAQNYYLVDCSGANPSYFPSITAALAVAGPNSFVIVTTPCTENVVVANASNLDLGAYSGQAVTITGNITVNSSNSVFLYGLNVTNPTGDAFDINNSHDTTLWTCTGNGNHGLGLYANLLSDVIVDGPSSFDNNASGGIQVELNSTLQVQTWGGPVDISNNQGLGVYAGIGAVFETLGNTTIENNVTNPTSLTPTGYGAQAVGASKVQIGTCFGPNQISGNQNGGFDIEENSELSIWSCAEPYVTTVTGNGPVGVSAGFGSQVTLYENAQILHHSGSGVELYGNSQLHVFGTNGISQNGSISNLRSAGIVLDGNSEAYLRGGEISQNDGPGILALVNSSADFTGVTFAGNSGGVISCDTSAYMVSDLATASNKPPFGVACRTPHNLGNRRGFVALPRIPDLTSAKARAALYMAQATPKAKPQ